MISCIMLSTITGIRCSLFNELERVLENAREAFIQWRYIYELDRAQFDEGVFKETVEMILAEFESRIMVVKHPR